MLDMAYHWDKGGILTKSDVGSFLYNNTLKPYALSEISPTSMIIPNSVDSLTYTSFESVKTIQEDPYSATFVYNADNGRAKMEVKQNTTTILTRWYPSGSYIKETASGTTKEYTFIGGDPYTAPVVGITQSGTTTYYYLLRDHLGSITHVVDASSGTLSYQYSYDAWGRMRTYSGWVNYNPGSEPALFIAGRGFTGHERLPWFNLINMLSEGMVNEVKWVGAKSRERSDSGNGRMYDPLAGQFLSPDNNIQDPYNSQNLNRYSYCLNNPMKYVDPSGENVWSEYISNLGRNGYGVDYGTFQDYYYESYYEKLLGNSLTSSAGGSQAKTYVWYERLPTGNSIVTTQMSTYNGQRLIIINEAAEVSEVKRSITINFASSGGDHSFMDYMSFGVNAGNLYYSVTGSALHNELYWVQKNGTSRLTQDIGSNYLLKRSYRITGELAESAKTAARSFAYAFQLFQALTWLGTSDLLTHLTLQWD
jgi:RHS repeat-associated protein